MVLLGSLLLSAVICVSVTLLIPFSDGFVSRRDDVGFLHMNTTRMKRTTMVRHANPVEPMNTPATSAQGVEEVGEFVLFMATKILVGEGSKVGLGTELVSIGNTIHKFELVHDRVEPATPTGLHGWTSICHHALFVLKPL